MYVHIPLMENMNRYFNNGNNELQPSTHAPYEWDGHEKPVGGKSKFRLWGHVIPVTRQLLNRKPFNVLKEKKNKIIKCFCQLLKAGNQSEEKMYKK